MKVIANVLTALMAALRLGFLVLERFFLGSPGRS
jgi:hypothetical protein